jgi:prephenate dehydrogenase
VGDEKRGGRLVPVYRTTHDSFVLHLSHLPHATIDALMDFLAGQWWWERFKSAYTRAWDAGLLKGRIRIFREGDSAIVDSLPETPQVDEAIHNHWRRMTLTKAQVARLREDMEQMLDEYSELINSESEETVVVHVAAVRESLRR